MTTVGKPAKDVFLKTTPEKLYNRKRLGINIDEYKNHFYRVEGVDRQLLAKCVDVYSFKDVIYEHFQ